MNAMRSSARQSCLGVESRTRKRLNLVFCSTLVRSQLYFGEIGQSVTQRLFALKRESCRVGAISMLVLSWRVFIAEIRMSRLWSGHFPSTFYTLGSVHDPKGCRLEITVSDIPVGSGQLLSTRSANIIQKLHSFR